jgi:hypothetical protein
MEREGGISPVTSPFMSVTELGNIFSSKSKFRMPTVDKSIVHFEFTSAFALMSYLSQIGE